MEELENLCDWGNELQLETYELRYEMLSKNESVQTAWNTAAEEGLRHITKETLGLAYRTASKTRGVKE